MLYENFFNYRNSDQKKLKNYGSSGLTMRGQDPGGLKPSHTNAYRP
jgi:hypothetical protein